VARFATAHLDQLSLNLVTGSTTISVRNGNFAILNLLNMDILNLKVNGQWAVKFLSNINISSNGLLNSVILRIDIQMGC
jgi:hypothetical protein